MVQQTSSGPIIKRSLRLGGLALRNSLAQRSAETQALDTPSVREGESPSDRWAGQQLRSRALDRDASHGQRFELSRLWFELCAGQWRLRETFATEQRYYAVVEQRAAGCRRAVPTRSLQILTRVLLGQTQKALAIDLQLSPSTVAGSVHSVLRAMGVCCRGGRAPVLLTMAAHSAHRPGGVRARGRLSQLVPGESEQEQLWIVSVPRPDLDFPVCLSNAELAVVQALAAGRSHAEISSLRATSPRTVANQVAAAFRKLGVSGRGEMLNQLVAHYLEARDLDDRREPPVHGEEAAGAA